MLPVRPTVDAMFQAFSHVAMLNPDMDDGDEDMMGSNLIYNLDEVQMGAEQVRVSVCVLCESVLFINFILGPPFGAV